MHKNTKCYLLNVGRWKKWVNATFVVLMQNKNELNGFVIWLNGMAKACWHLHSRTVIVYVENHITPTRQLQFAFLLPPFLALRTSVTFAFAALKGRTQHDVIKKSTGMICSVFVGPQCFRVINPRQSFTLTIVSPLVM